MMCQWASALMLHLATMRIFQEIFMIVRRRSYSVRTHTLSSQLLVVWPGSISNDSPSDI
jgi:hypothetical protein